MSFDKWAGDLIGVPEGLHAIGPGQAALFGFVVVILGWIITSRQQKEKYRVESARSTLMTESEHYKKYIPHVFSYYSDRKSFPTYPEVAAHPKKELGTSVQGILTLLEILALDVAAGRASERYVRQSQRSMVCTISICSQIYINSARESRNEKRLYQALEILFIRFYFNRYHFCQWTLEFIWGQPLYRYSYLMFRLRYLIACVPFGFDWNYRHEPWPRIKENLRKMRRITEAIFLGFLLILIAGIESAFPV